MGENSTTVEDKLRALFALKRGAKTEHEAHAALLAVQRLVARHNIDAARAAELAGELPKSSSKKDVRTWFWKKNNPEMWEAQLINTIAVNFRCIAINNTAFEIVNRQRKKVKIGATLYGLPEDVLVAHAVFEAAHTSAKECFHEYMLSKAYMHDVQEYRQPWLVNQPLTPNERYTVRQSFLRGFSKGLWEQFKHQVTQEDYALIVVAPAAVREHIDDIMTVKKPRAVQHVDTYPGVKQVGVVRGREFVPVAKPKQIGAGS